MEFIKNFILGMGCGILVFIVFALALFAIKYLLGLVFIIVAIFIIIYLVIKIAEVGEDIRKYVIPDIRRWKKNRAKNKA